ncbi:MAG: SE1832 family protein [Caryophanon sp.]|nr:SE1832 family protein [Caryophanon sp.]
MATKSDIQSQIAELKMDYVNLQGDLEKLESLGHADSVTKAVERLNKLEERLAELNKQLAAL